MSHLKKDFKFHKLFNNKYADQTKLAYMCRENKKYIPRSGEYIPTFVIATIDFIIKCNNNICRRGDVITAIANIKNDYEYNKAIYGYTWIKPISKYYDVEIEEKYDFETTRQIRAILDKIRYWEDKFETDYEGFKDFIYDTIKWFDTENFDWVFADGEDIIYDRSIRDKESKRLYCTLNNEKVIKRFKNEYFSYVFVDSKDKAKLYNQISFMLITISDINNYIITKEYGMAIELLEDFFSDNNKMKSCIDIYYVKVFDLLYEVYELLKQGKNQDAYTKLKKIVDKENSKYTDVILFEHTAIDLKDSTYSKIINL